MVSGSRDASRDVWDVSWDASRYVVPKSRYVVPEFRDVVPKSRYVVPEFRDVEPHPGTHPGTLGRILGRILGLILDALRTKKASIIGHRRQRMDSGGGGCGPKLNSFGNRASNYMVRVAPFTDGAGTLAPTLASG